MANCTISTMEVNDCHLQFFDSLGNLIYEFDLETIIALNNGNGILIKDELTTLTIDKTIVVDNLELTIAELITYIQEQRVLCDCCASAPAASVTSATWGYDGAGVLFYVKQMSDGSVEYESPIGSPATPTGNVVKSNIVIATLTFNIIETTSFGIIPLCVRFKVENVGGAAGTVNGVNLLHQHEPVSGASFFNEATQQQYLSAGCTYDASPTTFLITYENI